MTNTELSFLPPAIIPGLVTLPLKGGAIKNSQKSHRFVHKMILGEASEPSRKELNPVDGFDICLEFRLRLHSIGS